MERKNTTSFLNSLFGNGKRIKNNYIKLLISILLGIFVFPQIALAANPSSSNYELKDYGFGSGGTATSSSSNYSMFGTLGEVDMGSPSSTNYNVRSGLTYTVISDVPPAPSFTNPSNNYDRLKIVITQSQNTATDITYAVEISSDNFATDTRYVQSDATVGSVLGSEDWLSYSSWGGSSGTYITGLLQNTTYTVRVKARQGYYTESQWGPQSTATTSVPSLTFGVDSSTITFSNLNSGNSYTDSSKSTVLTTSTNAYNGYVVNARSTQPLTLTSNPSKTISDYASSNASPTTWSGTGFGYTTNDSNLTGGTADRFTNGGPNYAGFSTASPGDPVADHAGPVVNSISNEQFTISYRVTTSNTQAAGSYTTTVYYIVVPTY